MPDAPRAFPLASAGSIDDTSLPVPAVLEVTGSCGKATCTLKLARKHIHRIVRTETFVENFKKSLLKFKYFFFNRDSPVTPFFSSEILLKEIQRAKYNEIELPRVVYECAMTDIVDEKSAFGYGNNSLKVSSKVSVGYWRIFQASKQAKREKRYFPITTLRCIVGVKLVSFASRYVRFLLRSLLLTRDSPTLACTIMCPLCFYRFNARLNSRRRSLNRSLNAIAVASTRRCR